MSNHDKKHLAIIGKSWVHFPLLSLLDKAYNFKYVAFYNTKEINHPVKDRMITFNEHKKIMLLRPFQIVKRIYLLHKAIKDFKPSIITGIGEDANISCLPLMFIENFILRKKIKFVASMRSGAKEYNYSNHFMIMLCIKLFYRFFDKITTCSQGNCIALQKKFNFKRTDYFYVPANPKYYSNVLSEKLNLSEKNKYFGKGHLTFITIGRLTLQKCQWVQLKVFKEIIKEFPKSKLLIIGEGELRNYLEEKIKHLGLENNIFLPGFKKNPFPYIRECKASILTSQWEGLSRVIIDSLLVNKLIVTTDHEWGAREILAPDLTLTEKIGYPFIGKYGILTKDFEEINNYEEYDFSRELSIEEEQIKKVLIDICKGKYKDKYKDVKEGIKQLSQEKVMIRLLNIYDN